MNARCKLDEARLKSGLKVPVEHRGNRLLALLPEDCWSLSLWKGFALRNRADRVLYLR